MPILLSQPKKQPFEQSLKTDRATRALSENLIFEEINQDTSSKPIKVTSRIRSESGRRYHTTLAYCSCPDSQIRHVVCKHMIALAIKVKAITLDAPPVETSADKEMIALMENSNDSFDNDLPF